MNAVFFFLFFFLFFSLHFWSNSIVTLCKYIDCFIDFGFTSIATALANGCADAVLSLPSYSHDKAY